jgi:hypothetical protein
MRIGSPICEGIAFPLKAKSTGFAKLGLGW